ASRARRQGPANRRAQGWYALALLRRTDSDDRGAAEALRRGLTVLDGYRASLGATELRANSGSHGQELASEGLDIAIGSGSPARVLTWAERWRANALRMRAVVPPRDPDLAAGLARLRMVSTALEDALLAGRPVGVLRRQQAQLEQRIRELSRRVGGTGELVAPPGVRALSGQLGPAVLVELVTAAGRLWAVVVRDGRATLHDLGPMDEVLRQVRLYRFALRRLVVMGDSTDARAALAHAAARLDDQLLGPVHHLLADRPLVMVPVAALHAVPWAGLPSCAGRPVTVAPSATVWLRATRQIPPDGVPVLVAGPRLAAADTEVRALADVLPDAVSLTGGRATADAVITALDGAGLAHVAAHGSFRVDNPLFSTLELTDGPLTAYELERLARPPGCVVLSACDSGLSAVRPGDELLGFTAVLLGAGTRTLIASLLPVPADLTTALMLDLHRRMRAGESPAVALVGAQQALLAAGDGPARATAAAFVCLGAG
ncbi:MAG TPA: CHAT domain-containing protein, partial [Micromonospora sp.]